MPDPFTEQGRAERAFERLFDERAAGAVFPALDPALLSGAALAGSMWMAATDEPSGATDEPSGAADEPSGAAAELPSPPAGLVEGPSLSPGRRPRRRRPRAAVAAIAAIAVVVALAGALVLRTGGDATVPAEPSAAGSWQKTAPIPIGQRYGAISLWAGSAFYIIGG
ncbi:MAG: hypothetical protein QM633_13580, partial [Propionicimonas sp.]